MDQALINESHHRSEGDRTQEVHQLPQTDWLIDEQIIFINNSNSNSTQRVCFLATGERWYYSRVVRDGLLPSQQYQRNNKCFTVQNIDVRAKIDEHMVIDTQYTRTFRFSWGKAVKIIAHGYSISVGSGEKNRGAVFGSE